MSKLKQWYQKNKDAKVDAELKCPSCQSKFIKRSYQQAFCKTKPKTQCKDKYWNTVDPNKRNNKTRISPASARWLSKQEDKMSNYIDFDDEHPFSSEGLGQWCD